MNSIDRLGVTPVRCGGFALQRGTVGMIGQSAAAGRQEMAKDF